MKKFKNLFFVAMLITLLGSSTNKTQAKEPDPTLCIDAVTGATKTEMNFVFLAGASYGGIVDNQDASGIEGATDVDAITGATKISYNAGIHSIIKGHGRTIETGLDYMRFNQSVEYDLPSLSVNGTRNFEIQQVRMPLTYNFEFFKNYLNKAKLALKLGFSVGYTFSKTIEDSEDSENMPDYEFTDWEIGPAFGLYFYPVNFKQSYRIGLYLDAYRGRKIYEDVYHEGTFLGDNSFLNFGLVFEP
jgi:hypothetical protein